ncbi:hypothetical protein GCM10015535_03280 [Streptomyces gelaticus]|uniref:Uncharacterized protein n=1 Tax=Streptomyces gelaticus TaxID=285446 RepID=A0ABQ2VSZ0_9ACTN|nr:hypothetical protein GCM10015535_03280 [Streptomyces gelaticus]
MGHDAELVVRVLKMADADGVAAAAVSPGYADLAQDLRKESAPDHQLPERVRLTRPASTTQQPGRVHVLPGLLHALPGLFRVARTSEALEQCCRPSAEGAAGPQPSALKAWSSIGSEECNSRCQYGQP